MMDSSIDIALMGLTQIRVKRVQLLSGILALCSKSLGRRRKTAGRSCLTVNRR